MQEAWVPVLTLWCTCWVAMGRLSNGFLRLSFSICKMELRVSPWSGGVGICGSVSLGAPPCLQQLCLGCPVISRQRLCSVAASREKPGDFLLLSPLSDPRGAPLPPPCRADSEGAYSICIFFVQTTPS